MTDAATNALSPERLNRRQLAKARTRDKVLAAVRALAAEGRTWQQVTIRQIAVRAGMSTGAVFANWSDKADLWREAFGQEPPVDGPAVRAAHATLAALKGLVAVRPTNWDDVEDPESAAAWRAADVAIAQAEAA